MLSALLAGFAFGLFMSISVGPIIFAIVKYSVSYGWKAGISFVIGVSVSDIIYVALANLTSGWLEGMLIHEKLIGYAGALLFIGMGVFGFFKKIVVTRNPRDIATVNSRHYRKIMASGFLLNTFNPGVVLTWITSVATIASQNSSYRFVFFVTTLGLILGIDLFKVLLAEKIRKKLNARNIIYMNRISALCIFAIGMFLLVKVALDIKIGGM